MNRYLTMIIALLTVVLGMLIVLLFSNFQKSNEADWQLSALQGEAVSLKRELESFAVLQESADESQLLAQVTSLESQAETFARQLSQEEALYQAALSDLKEIENAISEAEGALEEKQRKEREEAQRRASEAAASSSSRAASISSSSQSTASASSSSGAAASSSSRAAQRSDSSGTASASSSQKSSQLVVNPPSSASSQESSSSKISVVAIPKQSEASSGSESSR